MGQVRVCSGLLESLMLRFSEENILLKNSFVFSDVWCTDKFGQRKVAYTFFFEMICLFQIRWSFLDFLRT